MRTILNSQPGKNCFSRCYVLSSKARVVDPNTLSKAGRLHRVDNKGYYWEFSTQPLSILPQFLQAEITDFPLCFVMKIQQRQGFLVRCPIVVRHNFLKRGFFLWLIYLFSFECSLNPPFLLGATAAACDIGLPSLNDCNYHLSWSKIVSKRATMWAWLWIHYIAVLRRSRISCSIRGKRGPASELTLGPERTVTSQSTRETKREFWSSLLRKMLWAFKRWRWYKSIHQGRKPILL